MHMLIKDSLTDMFNQYVRVGVTMGTVFVAHSRPCDAHSIGYVLQGYVLQGYVLQGYVLQGYVLQDKSCSNEQTSDVWTWNGW